MPPLDKIKPKNIIIRMPNWIGDLIMAIPVLTDLRKAYPDAQITAMCRNPLASLLQQESAINEIFSFNKYSAFSRRHEGRDIIQKLRAGKYDLGILLTNTFSSAWWFWQGKVTRRLGYTGHFRKLLLTDPLTPSENRKNQHLVLTYKEILKPLGIPCSTIAPKLYLTEKEISEAKNLLVKMGVNTSTKLIGINPGAAYGSAKCWLPERFREVTLKLLEDPRFTIVYFGDTLTAPLVKQICLDLPERVINLAGLTSLRELAALISLCDVLLTNDSGPMHMASALQTPVVALFGSTNPLTTGPYTKGTVIHKHVSCSPCYKRVCPIDFRCMKQIEGHEVLKEIYRSLEKRETNA